MARGMNEVYFGGGTFDNGLFRIEQLYRMENGKRAYYFKWTYADGMVVFRLMRQHSAELAERWLKERGLIAA